MKFNITSISKEDGGSLEIEDSGRIDMLDAQAFDFIGPVSVKGTLTNIGGNIRADVDVYAEYSTQCGRCLSDVKGIVEFKLSETFAFIDRDDTIVDAEQYYPIEGEWLELDKAVTDGIIVTLPLAVLCSEDCRGLCVNCGANLNEGECFCSNDDMNPAMEKLKNYFNDN